jgi:hypothetical protein
MAMNFESQPDSHSDDAALTKQKMSGFWPNIRTFTLYTTIAPPDSPPDTPLRKKILRDVQKVIFSMDKRFERGDAAVRKGIES